MSKKINVLADLLAAAVDIKPSESAEDTIERAVKKLEKQKANKPIADKIKQDVPSEREKQLKEQLDEMITDMHVSTVMPAAWNTIKRQYVGSPDIVSWSGITEFCKETLCQNQQELDEWDQYELDDTSFEQENGITWSDIKTFLSSVPIDDYTLYFEPDEIDVELPNYDEFECDSDYRDCMDYTDDQLAVANDKVDKLLLSCVEPAKLTEALTISQRLKKALRMRARAAQIAMKRKIAMRKRASPERISQRARRLAVRMLKSKFAGSKPYNQLSYADRERVEKIIATRKSLVDTLHRKLIPVVRNMERQRFEKLKGGELAKNQKAVTSTQTKPAEVNPGK